MGRALFWLLVVLNAAGLGLWLLLGLAAAKPSHTPVPNVLAFFAVPAAALAAVAVLYEMAPWPWARPAAVVLAALPIVVVLGGSSLSAWWAWRAGERAASTPSAVETPLRPSPQQLEAALHASRDTGTEPVRALLHAGALPNERGHTAPAWFAALAATADPQTLPLLLDRGADLGAVDAAGRDPVRVAMAQRRWDAAALLIERGAAWQHVQLANGQTIVQFAASELRRAGLPGPEAEALARLQRAAAARR